MTDGRTSYYYVKNFLKVDDDDVALVAMMLEDGRRVLDISEELIAMGFAPADAKRIIVVARRRLRDNSNLTD